MSRSKYPKKDGAVFSQTVEYALRAVVFLADRDSPGTTQEIAEVTKVPPAYLAKVLASLGKAGLVQSRRGPGGGCVLTKPPGDLTVWEVVDAVEPLQRIRTCPLGLDAHRSRLCPLHKKMDDALAQVERAFRDTTIGELLATPTTSRPLCPFPHVP
jgi:Rrf2 family protein